MLLLACFWLDAVLFVGAVIGGWPDLALSSLGGDGRRRRAQIRELAPVDGRSPTASSRFLDGCQFRLHFKASVQWDFSSPWW